jgi:hypothetical protein
LVFLKEFPFNWLSLLKGTLKDVLMKLPAMVVSIQLVVPVKRNATKYSLLKRSRKKKFPFNWLSLLKGTPDPWVDSATGAFPQTESFHSIGCPC